MKVYAASEAIFMANQANQNKYKKELLTLMDGAMFVVVEAARQGNYKVEFDPETKDKQLIKAFIKNMQTLGYSYDESNGEIYW